MTDVQLDQIMKQYISSSFALTSNFQVYSTIAVDCLGMLSMKWPITVKPVFFVCPLFREFCEPGKFAKITGRENLNTVAFQCNRKQKRRN